MALPLIAGASTSLIDALGAGRRAKRYSSMAERLGRLLPGVKTYGAMTLIISEVEKMMLTELIEWHVASGEVRH